MQIYTLKLIDPGKLASGENHTIKPFFRWEISLSKNHSNFSEVKVLKPTCMKS